MSFYDRFELLELLRDDGVKTFRATELATGRPVEAHLFVHPHAPLSVALLARLDQLPDEDQSWILDRGRHEGTPYVVTLPLSDYPSFREWVSAKRPKSGSPLLPPTRHEGKSPLEENKAGTLGKAGAWHIAPPPPPAMAPPKSTNESVELRFRDLFGTMETAAVRPAAVAPPPMAPVIQPAGIIQPESAVASRQEKTLELPMGSNPFPPALQQPQPPASDLAAESAAEPSPWALPLADYPSGTSSPFAVQEPAAPGSESASSTKLFETPQSPPAPPVLTNAPGTKPAGEFTMMLQGLPAKTPELSTPIAGVPATNQPGEFTRMLQQPAAGRLTSEAPASPAAPSAPMGEFTRMFQAQPPGAPRPPAKLPDSQPAVTTGGSSSPPGEFTRMFQAQPPAKQPAAAAPPPPPAISQPVAGASGSPRPGEFTRMINSSALKPPPAPLPQPPARPSPAAPPGEFTRMFQGPVSAGATNPANPMNPANLAPPAASRAPQPPGEFTRFFQSPAGPMPQSPAVQQPLQPQAPGTAGANKIGEFTQVFGRGEFPQAPPPAAAPPPVAQPPSSATHGFTLPAASYPQAPYAAPNYGQPAQFPGADAAGYPAAYPGGNAYPQGGYYNPYNPYGVPAPKGPSDFTQKFSAPAGLTLGQAPPAQPGASPAPPPQAAPAPSALKAKLPLLIGGGVLVLVLIGWIVFLLTRTK